MYSEGGPDSLEQHESSFWSESSCVASSSEETLLRQVMLLSHSDSYLQDKAMQVTLAFIQIMPRKDHSRAHHQPLHCDSAMQADQLCHSQ